MATDTQVIIRVGRQQIEAFKSFKLEQEIDAHHHFELICRRDVLEYNSSELLGLSKEFLGENFAIEIQTKKGFSKNETLQFKGIVSSINIIKGAHRQTGDLVKIKGKSTSVITDDGPNYASFTDLSLSEILEKTFMGYNKSALNIVVAPEKKDTIHYSVQQNESAYAYASRLAAQYGEWFYYNGKTLIFGKPEHNDVVELAYGYNLTEFAMNLEPIPNQFNYFTNDYLSDSFHEAKTNEIGKKIEGYNSFVSSKSEQLYPKETQVFVSAHDDPKTKHRMDSQITKQKLSNEINQVKITGISTNPAVTLGSIIRIVEENTSHGEFRITNITHTCSENGRYQNEFEAITANADIYPKTSVHSFPKSKIQTAIIVDNVDPEGMGRVKIQYPWQKKTGETTPWIRQASLSGGSGQGMYFVPEKGDEVIVAHEGDNAEAPFVQGSLLNASSVPGDYKSGDNHLKAIRTRSGNQVTLNDADGSVTIADPSGNTIVMGGNGEITINAPNKITFSSTDINIEASNDLTVNAGNNITSSATTDISSSAGANLNIDAGTNVKIDAGTNLNAKAGAKAAFSGKKSISLSGKRASITGSVMTNIQSGALVTIISAGLLNITGATSFINGKIMKLIGKQVEINN